MRSEQQRGCKRLSTDSVGLIEMNNYMSVSSDEELARKEHLQEQHYRLQSQLQTFAKELPIKYQQRMSCELLNNLANCLLDDTIVKIVNGLRDIQLITEKTLFEQRMKKVGKFREMKVEQQKRHKQELAEGKTTGEKVKQQERELERFIEDETNKIDMKTVTQLDQVVSDQQVTLEKAGVPGFFVTNKPEEVRLQMYILELILRLGESN